MLRPGGGYRRFLAAQVEKKYYGHPGPQMNDVWSASCRIAQASDSHELTYRFRFIEDPKDKDS
jgi:hypothetical protein